MVLAQNSEHKMHALLRRQKLYFTGQAQSAVKNLIEVLERSNALSQQTNATKRLQTTNFVLKKSATIIGVPSSFSYLYFKRIKRMW